MTICERCGSSYKLETDRIIPGIEGGQYVEGNTRELCQACHKYRHVRDSIVSNLKYEREYIHQQDRIEVLVKRLEILDRENTPEQISERGYYSYFNEYKEYIPLKRKQTPIPKEQGNLL